MPLHASSARVPTARTTDSSLPLPFLRNLLQGKTANPNCLCGLVPAPESFRKTGLWARQARIAAGMRAAPWGSPLGQVAFRTRQAVRPTQFATRRLLTMHRAWQWQGS